MTIGHLMERCAAGRSVFTGTEMVDVWELSRIEALPQPMPPLPDDVQRVVVTLHRHGWDLRVERGQA